MCVLFMPKNKQIVVYLFPAEPSMTKFDGNRHFWGWPEGWAVRAVHPYRNTYKAKFDSDSTNFSNGKQNGNASRQGTKFSSDKLFDYTYAGCYSGPLHGRCVVVDQGKNVFEAVLWGLESQFSRLMLLLQDQVMLNAKIVLQANRKRHRVFLLLGLPHDKSL